MTNKEQFSINLKEGSIVNIKVVGIGDTGVNSINNMINHDLRGVEFIAINSDVNTLKKFLASNCIHIGVSNIIEDSRKEIIDVIGGADMLFIIFCTEEASDLATLVASCAKEIDALTVGIASGQFTCNEKKQLNDETSYLSDISKQVDTLIVVPNQIHMPVYEQNTSIQSGINTVEDVFRIGVQYIAYTINGENLVNIDFKDICSIMKNGGIAFIGVGESSGENSAVEATKAAISSSLLGVDIISVPRLLLNISGTADNVGMLQVAEASEYIYDITAEDTYIIWCVTEDETMGDVVRVTVIATGIKTGM